MKSRSGKRRSGRKQSGDRAASVAGYWLKQARALAKSFPGKQDEMLVPIRDVKTLCASVLSQDETKGKRK